jgi:DNA-binding NtrC family response regulator
MSDSQVQSPLIAIVDDDPFYSTLIEQHLANLGMTQITVFNNGHDFLDQINAGFDIVFLDHDMPEMVGVEVLRKIKRHNPEIYVVFLSGQKELKVAVNVLKYGAFDYIIKEDNDLERIEATLKKIQDIQKALKQKKNNNPLKGLFFNIF